MMKNSLLHILLLLIATCGVTSCSTTSRLTQGEVLYTGVKKVKYHQELATIDAGVQSQIFDAINVKPNNPLYSPYYRTPLPIGLWVYNHWDEEAGGVKGWLYKHLVARPVLVSRVRPATRVDMINTLLRNNGYFSSSASYELNYSGNDKKKASITYDIKVKPPYVLGDIKYMGMPTAMGHLIDSCAREHRYLQRGNRYCLDSLNAVRIDITNVLRNKGYYFFRPEYIEYFADSTTTRGVVNLQMIKAGNVPNRAQQRFLTRNVVVTVYDNSLKGTPDTVHFKKCTLVKMSPVHISDKLIPSCIRSRRGRPFKVGNMDRTQLYLSRMGIFSSIDMKAVPVPDSITATGDGLIDLNINCILDKPIEAKVEVQATSKSNSFIGPGLEFGVSNKNLLGGGENLTVNANASYEWQTGNGNSYNHKDLNSYEFGLSGELAVPRLLAPKFVDRSRKYLNWTKIALSASIMNRPGFFKMAQASTEFKWEWHAGRHSLNTFTPFKLTYSHLVTTTPVFDSIMNVNRAIALSFQNQFIPAMEFSYVRDVVAGCNSFTWTSTLTEAGNIFAGVWRLAGNKDAKKMFGTPFSQFLRGQTQIVLRRSLTAGSSLVGRAFLGIAHAYGNSSEVPYSYQFYIGGANSVRAFTVRTIGPGSYRPAYSGANAYYDQTGTFKFEANLEYRFPLLGYFHGAVFLDAGNVWLLKDDAQRPGGTLRLKKFFNELAVGTGVGLRFDMQMLVVRADLGIGIHAPYDTGERGYYNMVKFKDAIAFHLAIGYPF